MVLNPRNIMCVEVHRSWNHKFNISGSEVHQASLIDLIMMAIQFAFHKAGHFIELKTARWGKSWRIRPDKRIKEGQGR